LFPSVVPAFGSFLLSSQDVAEPRSRTVEELRSWGRQNREPSVAFGGTRTLEDGGHSSISRLHWVSTAKIREQTQNVYENKQQGQKVEQSASGIQPAARPFGPRPRRRRAVPRKFDLSTSRIRKSGNKPRMSMKTNNKVKKSWSREVESNWQPHVSGRDPGDGGPFLENSTCRPHDPGNRGTNPECL
jgi:hypothetical protein